jgi:hypothetical protein
MAKNQAKPGASPAPKAKKEKVEKIFYPGLNVVDGKPTTQLDSWPSDFDPKVHKGLTRKNFKNESPLLLRQAERLEEKAAKLRAEAKTIEKLGSPEQRNKAKKLANLNAQLQKMRAELEGEGVDVGEVLGESKAPAEAPAGDGVPAA